MFLDKPQVFNSKKDLPRGSFFADITKTSFEELFVIRNPRFLKEKFKSFSC